MDTSADSTVLASEAHVTGDAQVSKRAGCNQGDDDRVWLTHQASIQSG
jgi:hypothetical protein